VCVCLCAKMCVCDQVYVRVSTVVTRTHALLRDLLPFDKCGYCVCAGIFRVFCVTLFVCVDIKNVMCGYCSPLLNTTTNHDTTAGTGAIAQTRPKPKSCSAPQAPFGIESLLKASKCVVAALFRNIFRL